MIGYKLTPLAEFHLKEIWIYSVNTWGSAQAKRYKEEIKKSVQLLVNSPNIGKKRHEIEAGLMSFPAKSHNIYYFSEKGYIKIVGILHRRMDPNRHIKQN